MSLRFCYVCFCKSLKAKKQDHLLFNCFSTYCRILLWIHSSTNCPSILFKSSNSSNFSRLSARSSLARCLLGNSSRVIVLKPVCFILIFKLYFVKRFFTNFRLMYFCQSKDDYNAFLLFCKDNNFTIGRQFMSTVHKA